MFLSSVERGARVAELELEARGVAPLSTVCRAAVLPRPSIPLSSHQFTSELP